MCDVHVNASCLPIPKPCVPCRTYCSACLALHFLSVPILVTLHLLPSFILILLVDLNRKTATVRRVSASRRAPPLNMLQDSKQVRCITDRPPVTSDCYTSGSTRARSSVAIEFNADETALRTGKRQLVDSLSMGRINLCSVVRIVLSLHCRKTGMTQIWHEYKNQGRN
jgi:hypothetical protein